MHLNKKKRLNSVSDGFNRIRKSQSALETLILIGFGVGIITIFFFILLQQQGGITPDITSDKVNKLMSDIKEYSSMVIKIGPGNMVKVRVEVPSAINSIRYDANEISINYQDGENTSEIHGSTLVNITGFNFMDNGEVRAGDYPIIIESMGSSVCIYLPDRKSDYCSFEVNYSSNPVIVLPSTAYTNDNLTCFVNMSRFEDAKVDFTWYVNLTNGTVMPWHGDDENKVSANMSGFYTSTSSVGDLEPSDTHFNQSFICQATIWNQADTVSVNSSPVTILEYPSTLDAFDKEQDAESQPQSNDPKVYVNEWTTFYANYTTSKGFDLGQVMLRVGDIGTGYDVQGIDLNGDGVRNDFIFSEYDDMYAYWANGTQAWHIADSNFDYAYGIAVGDFDNDGEDNIAWASSYGFFTIINVSDGAVVYRTEDYDYCYAFASGDVDGDGRQDDFVIGARDVSGGNDNYGIIVFGYNETSGLYQNFWNATDSLSYPYEIDISEISTEENRVGVVDYSGGRPSVYYGNGTLKWKTPSDIGTVYGLEFFDQDSDGKADELAVGESSDLFIYDEDGTQLYQKTETNGGEYEVEKIDFDGDGIYDDIVVSSAYYYVHGFNGENGSQQWAYYSPLKPYETNYYSVYFTSMKVADVNDDGLDEIIVGGYNAKYYVLNITGDIIGKHYFGFETSHREDYPIGTTYSESTGIDIIDDVNGDAIPEILSSRLSGYVYYGQQVLCKVNLSSELHNMYYNYTSKLWEYYHFFNESGFDLTTPSSNTLDWNIICEKGGYVTQDSGTKDITVYVKNTALDVYDQQDDSENKAAWLSEDIVRLGNQTYFFANYTDLEVNTPVVGLGLNITWTNDIGWANYDVEAIDLDGDGLREGFVYTEYEDIFAFYPNGTQAWKRYDTTYDYMFGGLVVGDFNNDSKDEVAFPAYYGYLVVLNSSGDEMYQSPDMGTYCNAIAKGDLNDDGVDDIVISCYPLPGYGIVAYFYNSSSGNYEELWRVADGGSYIYEIKISEIDDGPNLVGVADGTGNEKGYVYYGVNGTKKFETHDMGSYAYTLEFIDYDNDGDEDEVIFGEYGENYRYNANGVGYSTHSIPGDIVYELETFDKDGDGIATDYVMFERFYVRALTKYGGQYWYYSLPDSMYASLNVADINNDGYEEIMITGDDATLYVFNVSGKLLTKKSLMIPGLFSPTEPVRPGYNYYGAGMGLAVSDRINNSAYLGFAADNAYVGMIETYPRCTVYFNNSESARMDFDSEHGLYYYNRSFDDSINNFTNGVFSTDENWTLGTNWSIGGGKALNNNMDPSVTELKQDINVIPGHTYQINYSVTDCTVCGVAASIGDENATYRYGAASYSETLKAITSATLVFKENSCPGFCGPTLLGIDNVIVTDLNQSAVGDYEWNVTCESLEHVKRTSATKTFNVTGMTLALDLLFPSSLNFSVKQYDIFNVTANVSCFYDDCGDVNVSVERQFTCDSDNQVCNNDCNTAFYPQAGDLSSSTYTSTFMCIRPHYGCYSNDGASYYMIDIDSYCDGIFGAGTGQCGVFLDATGGWDEYYCPGFVRKGGSVSSADCSCSNCGGGCGKSYNSIFDFGSPFFSGSTISNISGALPFYINSSHPMTINLNSGDSQEVVFWLNGTGTSYYDGFSVFAEKVGSSILINRTPLWNTTIIMPWIGFDLLNPTANINTPKDNFFNFTVNVSCHDADCGSINVSLYYDASLALSKMYETTHASNLPAIGSLGTDRSADKSNVTFSDGTLFSTTGATDTWEMQSFVFTDSDSSPGRIEVTWKGHEKSGCQFVTNSHGEHVYLYNYSNSSWLEINSTFVSSCNDRTLVTSLCSSGCGVTGDTSDFVSSDGNVTALARGYMEMWGDTSCPFLYSYNGTGYEFITDINSNGGLGYGAHYTPGAVMNPDPYAINPTKNFPNSVKDYMAITGEQLKPVDGKYKLVVAEHQSEITYFDSAELYVVDHPIGAEIYSPVFSAFDTSGLIDYEELIYHTVRDLQSPISAYDNDGNDVLDIIKEEDRIYTNGSQLQWDSVIVDLGNLSDAVQIKLLYNAYNKWAVASDFQNRYGYLMQHPEEPFYMAALSYMEVKDSDGNWVYAPEPEQIGSAHGHPRTMLWDITHWFDINNHTNFEIRINHFYNIRMDYIAFDTSEDESITITKIKPSSAVLEHNGVPYNRTRAGGPPIPNYYQKSLSPDLYSDIAGKFTKLGDVMPLVDLTDNKYVMMMPGDEIMFEFDELELLEKEGTERDYYIYTTAYFKGYKGTNTLDEPYLKPEQYPFVGMSNYPYNEYEEQYPYDQSLLLWNTRQIDSRDKHNTFYTDYIALSTSAYAGGLVSNVSGTQPIYTNATSNPQTIYLNEDEAQEVVFWINASGSVGDKIGIYLTAVRLNHTSTTNTTIMPNVTFISPIVYGLGTTSSGAQSDTYIFVNATANGSIFNPSRNISLLIDFNDSLVSWWTMDNVAGSTVVDHMGRNNGTAAGASQTSSGYLGKGFNFDGAGDYVNTSIIMNSNEVSYGGWMKFNTFNCAGTYCVPMQQADASNVGFEIYTLNVGTVHCWNGTSSGFTPAINLATGEWYHIMCVHNTTHMTIYVNGSYTSSIISTGLPSAEEFVIGGGVQQNNYWFNGTIDDVMIFNRSLTATETVALYINTSTKYLERNFTGLGTGNHNFTAYVQDSDGYIYNTSRRDVTIS